MSVMTLDADQVRQAVSMTDAIDAVRRAFVALASGEFEMPTRTGLGDGSFLVMPVHHRPSGSCVVKALSLNFDGRDPAIAGTVTWSRLRDDRALIADATEVTRIRTGAVTGVATDLLAPASAHTCAMIGAGAQAPDQIRAVHTVRPLTELRIVSRTRAHADALARSMRDELPGVEVTVLDQIDQAVAGVDIVCCATTATEPLVDAAVLADTVHVNAVGSFRPSMRELPDELLAGARIVIDERAAALEEAGELIHALAAGVITESDLDELGPALGGGAVAALGRTVFKSVGVAIQDWAIADLLAARVERLGWRSSASRLALGQPFQVEQLSAAHDEVADRQERGQPPPPGCGQLHQQPGRVAGRDQLVGDRHAGDTSGELPGRRHGQDAAEPAVRERRREPVAGDRIRQAAQLPRRAPAEVVDDVVRIRRQPDLRDPRPDPICARVHGDPAPGLEHR